MEGIEIRLDRTANGRDISVILYCSVNYDGREPFCK